jgi:hypothetical protein
MANTTTAQSGASFRAAAKQDREQADSFRVLAQSYSGEVREKMMALVEYYEARAKCADYCAERIEKLAARKAVAS